MHEATTEVLGARPPALQPILEDPSLKEGEEGDEDEASVDQDAAMATGDKAPAPTTVSPDEAETQVTLESVGPDTGIQAGSDAARCAAIGARSLASSPAPCGMGTAWSCTVWQAATEQRS